MGKAINHDHRYTQEEREYLKSRGRGYMVAVNERRFGTEENPTDTPEGPQVNPFYDDSVRQKAVYDVGGAPLPNTTLDYNTGRVMDRDNGQLLEYTGPGHTPGAYDLRVDGKRNPEGFMEYSDDEEVDIDDDIVQYVVGLPNKNKLKEALKEAGAEFHSDDDREELENRLALTLQDKRDAGEKVEVPASEEVPSEEEPADKE